MMKLSTQPYKGARDFYPEDMRIQRHMFRVMREVVERYGYEAYDAPLLEPTELYLQKGNKEIIEEQTYTFTDRGDRSVTLRSEMTPSVARMVAGRRQELAYPLRWYSIPQCWRYERTQRGRGREFYQLNVDMFGEAGIVAEHEMLLVVRDLFRAFQADVSMYTIRLNSRAFMDWVFSDHLKLQAETQAELFRLIDRKAKLKKSDFTRQLEEVLRDTHEPQQKRVLLEGLLASSNLDEIPEVLRDHDSLLALRELISLCQSSDINNVVFDPTIARGFEYYNDIVFEVFDTDPANNRSLFGGGRYDTLLESFGVEPIPTIGFGMGDITLQNFLETHKLVPDIEPETDVYIVMFGDTYQQALELADYLRQAGIRVALDATNRKMDKMIKSADKKHIPYVLVVGRQEVDKASYTLKRLSDGDEQQYTRADLTRVLRS